MNARQTFETTAREALDRIGLDVEYENIHDHATPGIVKGVSEDGRQQALAAIMAAFGRAVGQDRIDELHQLSRSKAKILFCGRKWVLPQMMLMNALQNFTTPSSAGKPEVIVSKIERVKLEGVAVGIPFISEKNIEALGAALNELIDAYNDLERRYASHKHKYGSFRTTPPTETFEPPTTKPGEDA